MKIIVRPKALTIPLLGQFFEIVFVVAFCSKSPYNAQNSITYQIRYGQNAKGMFATDERWQYAKHTIPNNCAKGKTWTEPWCLRQCHRAARQRRLVWPQHMNVRAKPSNSNTMAYAYKICCNNPNAMKCNFRGDSKRRNQIRIRLNHGNINWMRTEPKRQLFARNHCKLVLDVGMWFDKLFFRSFDFSQIISHPTYRLELLSIDILHCVLLSLYSLLNQILSFL